MKLSKALGVSKKPLFTLFYLYRGGRIWKNAMMREPEKDFEGHFPLENGFWRFSGKRRVLEGLEKMAEPRESWALPPPADHLGGSARLLAD